MAVPVGVGAAAAVATLTRRSGGRRSAAGVAARGARARTQCKALNRVAVIGAGPSGLAAALSLQKIAGVEDVVVFEQAPELRPAVGGGLQLHGGAALLENELGVPLQSVANPLRLVKSRAADGDLLLELSIPALMDKFGGFADSFRLDGSGDAASCTVMRDALLKAIYDKLDPSKVVFGETLERVEENSAGGGVDLVFQSGRKESFDFLVAADGINSVAAQAVTATPGAEGDSEADKQYTGLRIQYGVAPAGMRPEGSDEEVHQWFGEDVYAFTGTYGGLGGQKYDMVVCVFRAEEPVDENISWKSTEGDTVQQAALRRMQAGGLGDEVLDIVRGCDRFFELGIYERPLRLTQWHRGRAALIGDAAHAMPPFLGQGANQAIQDAVCLARWMRKAKSSALANTDQNATLDVALWGYESQRQGPVAALSFSSGFLGQVETLPGELGAFVRNNFFRLTGALGVAELVFLNGAVVRA